MSELREVPVAKPSIWAALTSRRVLICVLTGFSSGLPLYLLINLLPAWLRTEGLSLRAIGAFALIQFPYTWKFIWAPAMDRYVIPVLGRRRGWMLITQIGLLVAITWIGTLSPKENISWIVYASAAIAFLSASQDIVLDAFRREILHDTELGLGNAVHVNAYRIASLIPGGLSLVLADHLPWPTVFTITAAFMVPGMVMVLMVKEPTRTAAIPKTLRDAVVEPFKEFMHRSGWQSAVLILSFIFFYKLGDSMATAIATPFYLDMGFAKSDIGIIAKNAGLWPSVIGALLGGIWMLKLGINRALWMFGLVQAVSILGFFWLAHIGPFTTIGATERTALALVIGFEALGVGLGTAAFVAYIARETNPAYTATQFALFTSLSAVPRTFMNALTGWMVENIGWMSFYLVCLALTVPGMLLLFKVAPWNQRP